MEVTMNEARLIIPEDANPKLVDILEKISNMNEDEFFKFAHYCLESNNETVVKNMACISLEKGYYELGLELVTKALEITKRPVEIYNLIATSFFHLRQFDTAIEYYIKAMNGYDKPFPVWRATILKNIACCYIEKEEYFTAQCKLHDAIQLIMGSDAYKIDQQIPELYVIYAILGDCYYKSEDHVSAIKYLKESINPSLPLEDSLVTYYNLGVIYEDQEDYQNALTNYQVALNTYDEVRNKAIIDPSMIMDSIKRMMMKIAVNADNNAS